MPTRRRNWVIVENGVLVCDRDGRPEQYGVLRQSAEEFTLKKLKRRAYIKHPEIITIRSVHGHGMVH
jgi:hypothetical protein